MNPVAPVRTIMRPPFPFKSLGWGGQGMGLGWGSPSAILAISRSQSIVTWVPLGLKKGAAVDGESGLWLAPVAFSTRVAMLLRVLAWKSAGIETVTPNWTSRSDLSLIIRIELPPAWKKSELG